MRSQIRSLVVQRCSLQSMDDVIIKCGGDDSTSFSWASLKEIDFSHNTVSQLGESLVRRSLMNNLEINQTHIWSINSLVAILYCMYIHVRTSQICTLGEIKLHML